MTEICNFHFFFVKVEDDEESTQESKDKGTDLEKFIAHVSVPSQKDIEQALLMRKKQELLEKYAPNTESDLKDPL